MKTRLFAVIPLLVALGVWAQDAGTGGSGQSDTGGSGQETPAPVAGGAVLGVKVQEVAVIATGYRASKLIGERVKNDKDETIGTVDDFIIKPDGTISYGILEVGGFLGVGAHRVAIPVKQFKQMKPHPVLPGATKDALKKMPEFIYAPD